jgi:hypothetical protein
MSDPTLYSWMRPAWLIGKARPGLRSATAADARRLRELPPLLGSVLLPALAVLLPVLLAAGQATTIPWTAPNPAAHPAVLVIHDLFTESVPFMLVAGIIGLAAPAAGVLLVLAHAVGDLTATAATRELDPLAMTLFARLVTWLVLWLLVVEIPLLGRTVFEWWSSRDDAPRSKRAAALVAATLAVGGLAFIWVLGAPLLVVIAFVPRWPQPTTLPGAVMVAYGPLLAAALAVAALALFGMRYFGPVAHVARAADEPERLARRASLPAYLASLVFTLVILSGVLREPVDFLILLAGVLAARPVARLVLRVTRLAPALARIVWPIRLIVGFGFALAFAWYFLAVVGVSQVSPFFNMVIAIAVGVVLIELFLAADDVVATAGLLLLVLPGVAFADNFSSQGDMPSAAAAAAAAAGAAGAASFERNRPKRQLPEYSGPQGQDSGGPGHGGGPPKLNPYKAPGTKPNPAPWWMPDGAAEFFGYDPPA